MSQFLDRNWSVGASLLGGLLLLIVPHHASGQPGPAESPSNIECVEHLEIPGYPPLARSAAVQVIQTVKLLLSDQATVQSIEQSLRGQVAKFDPLFKEAAETVLRRSRFSKTCGGRTITLVFHYEIRNDDGRSSLFAFEPPNHFWIRARPEPVMPSRSGESGR